MRGSRYGHTICWLAGRVTATKDVQWVEGVGSSSVGSDRNGCLGLFFSACGCCQGWLIIHQSLQPPLLLQAGYGQCGQSWMQGFCAQSCGRCSGTTPSPPSGCTDTPPDSRYTCAQQVLTHPHVMPLVIHWHSVARWTPCCSMHSSTKTLQKALEHHMQFLCFFLCLMPLEGQVCRRQPCW